MSNVNHPFGPLDIQSWVDGQLTDQEAKVVEAHVEACVECHDIAAAIHPVSAALAQWRVDEPPTMPMPRLSSSFPRLWRRVAQAAAAAVIVAAGLFWWAFPYRVSNADKPETQEVLWAVQADGTIRRLEPSEVFSAAAQSRNQLKQMTGGQRMTESLPTTSVVRTAAISLVSDDFNSVRAALERIVANAAGFIGNIDAAGNRGESQWLKATLRVPSSQLATVLAELKQLGTLVSESQRGEDVTTQTTDLDARLSNAGETEKRLVAVLQQRTGKVADVLEVEREIARVREQIERMTSERVRLRDRVTYATVTVDVREARKASLDLGTPSLTGRFRNALVEGTTAATSALLAMALFLIRVAPSLILAVIILAWPATVAWRRWHAAPQS